MAYGLQPDRSFGTATIADEAQRDVMAESSRRAAIEPEAGKRTEAPSSTQRGGFMATGQALTRVGLQP
ncbi:MAG: hypothetical protein OXO52_04825 [Rhodospirillales bacterium]|nr:hypothetical protein [Rhodospirillales bacterium]MDE0380190.1 hypothetical protein [Rhodospirillales bacterium]